MEYPQQILGFQDTKYQADPESFLREVLGVKELFDWQIDVCEHIKSCFQSQERHMLCLVAVAGANNTGKTHFGRLLLVWHFLTQYESRNLMMTNSERQTKNTSFYQIRIIIEKVLESNDFSATEKSVLFKDKKGDSAGIWDLFYLLKTGCESALSGFHPERFGLFLDESLLYPNYVWDAIETMLFSGRVFLYTSANPLEIDNRFFDIFNDKKNILGWYRRKVSIFEIPEEYVSHKMAHHRLAKYGESDPRYRCNVLGEFPLQATGKQRFTRDLVLRAMEEKESSPSMAQLTLSIDVALDPKHGCANAFCLRRGLEVYELMDIAVKEEEFTRYIIGFIEERKPELIIVDANGIGCRLHYELGVLLKDTNIKVVGIKGHSSAGSSNIFADLRAELAYKAADWIMNEECKMPFIPNLEKALPLLTFGQDNRGKITLVSKKDLVKEMKAIGVSMDILDAFIYSFYDVYTPRSTRGQKIGWTKPTTMA